VHQSDHEPRGETRASRIGIAQQYVRMRVPIQWPWDNAGAAQTSSVARNRNARTTYTAIWSRVTSLAGRQVPSGCPCTMP
jgi:hypothetical protein